MAPGHVHVGQAAPGLVDSVLGVHALVLAVRVVHKELGVDDAGGVLATDREGVPDHRPLGLRAMVGVQQDFPQVVDQTNQMEPLLVRVLSEKKTSKISSIIIDLHRSL